QREKIVAVGGIVTESLGDARVRLFDLPRRQERFELEKLRLLAACERLRALPDDRQSVQRLRRLARAHTPARELPRSARAQVRGVRGVGADLLKSPRAMSGKAAPQLAREIVDLLSDL